MLSTSTGSLASVLDFLSGLKLINDCERARAFAIQTTAFPFHDVVQSSDSIHLHVKVDDANDAKLNSALSKFCDLEYSKEGFVKFRYTDGVNLIFSSIPVSEDELVETECQRRSRPFLDHIGIDLRDESEHVKKVFSGITDRAAAIGWACVSQGSDGKGVHCCHVEVQAKHWVFPSESSPSPQIPLEFAFGKLITNDVSGGCDLRPMDPIRKSREGVEISACHE